MTADASVVEVAGLVKRYGDKAAVDGLSFAVQRGEVYGLLGVNGAGKTTTIEILEGHRQRTDGNIRVLGEDPATAGREFRDRIGIVLQSSGVEAKHTVREALDLYRMCYSNPRSTAECIGLLGLDESADKRIESLSGGQKRRVDFALGVLGRPELLFLDEPTTGFDPAARRASWDLIRSLRDEGTTVILTSHYLDEVEHLADRVGVIAGGRMIVEGTTAALLAASGVTEVRFDVPAGVSADELAGVVGDVENLDVVAGRCEVRTSRPTAVLGSITSWSLGRGEELGSLTVGRPSLEEMFLHLVDEGDGADRG